MNQAIHSSKNSKLRRYSSFALLGVIALYGGCAKSCGGSSATIEGNLSLVPSDTKLVGELNFKNGMTSDNEKKFNEALAMNPSAKKQWDDFSKNCAINPLKDIESIFLAADEKIDQKSLVIIVRGSFDEEKVVSCFKKMMGEDRFKHEKKDYNGHTIYEQAEASNRMAFSLLGKGVFVLSSSDRLRKVLDLNDKKQGASSAKDNKELSAAMKRVPVADAALWGAATFSTQAPEELARNFTGIGMDMSSMKDAAFAIMGKDGIRIHLSTTLGGKDQAEAQAKKVNELFEQLKSQPMYKVIAGSDDLLKNVKAFSNDNIFKFDASLDQKQLTNLTESLKNLVKMAPPSPALLGVIALYGGCAKSCGGSSATIEGNLSLVPSDTKLVGELNFKNGMTSDNEKKFNEALAMNPSAKKQWDDFSKNCAINPLKDIESIFLAADEKIDQKSLVIIVRGSFDEEKVVSCFKKMMGEDRFKHEKKDYNGHTIYEQAEASNRMAFSLLGKGVFVLSSSDRLRKVLDLNDKKQGASSAKDNKELSAAMKRVPVADAALWGAATFSTQAPEELARNFTGIGMDMSSMKDAAFAIMGKDGIRIHLSTTLGGKDQAEAQAKKVNELFEQLKSQPMYKVIAGSDDLLKNVKAFSNDNIFKFDASLDQKQLTNLTESLKNLVKMAPPSPVE